MPDLTTDQAQRAAESGLKLYQPDKPISDGVTAFESSLLFLDPATGTLEVSPAGHPEYTTWGYSTTHQPGDGDRAAICQNNLVERDNSTGDEEIPADLPQGWPVYAKDNQTFSLTDGGGFYPKAGPFYGMSPKGNPMVFLGMDPYHLTEVVITKTITFSDLTALALTQDFDLLELKGPAVVLGPPWIRAKTDFEGGGSTGVTVAVGLDADPDAIGDETNIFTASPAAPVAMVAGVNGAVGYPLAAGGVIKAQIASDVNVNLLTAGSVTISLRVKPGSY